MAQRPTLTTLARWIGIPVPDVDSVEDDTPLQLCLNTAVAYWEARLDVSLLTADGYSLAVDTSTYPEPLVTQVCMLGAKLYARRTSPEGVRGFGDFAIRVLPQDVEDETLVERWLAIGGFA